MHFVSDFCDIPRSLKYVDSEHFQQLKNLIWKVSTESPNSSGGDKILYRYNSAENKPENRERIKSDDKKSKTSQLSLNFFDVNLI